MDLATTIGWATWTPGQFPSYGAHTLPKCLALDGNPDVGLFLQKVEQWFLAMHLVAGPTHLCYEKPFISPKMHQKTAMKLLPLAGFIEYMCRRCDVRCFEVNNTKPRKHFFGKGAGKREEMKRLCLEEARRRGFDTHSDDAADAIAGLDYMAHKMNLQPDWPARGAGPLFTDEGKNDDDETKGD